jgi:uncharacterized protein YcbK (DUF882 family)
MKPDTKYGWFMPSETKCKCGCGLDIQDSLRDALNRMRNDFGFPLHVVSGARCAAYNKKVGGAKHSQHLKGLAADIALPLDGEEKHLVIYYAMREPTFKGRGFYHTFIHVDQREKHAYWVG